MMRTLEYYILTLLLSIYRTFYLRSFFRCVLCFVAVMFTKIKESYNAQIDVLHCLQYRAHISVECIDHLGVDFRISNDIITCTCMCSLDLSDICFFWYSLSALRGPVSYTHLTLPTICSV